MLLADKIVTLRKRAGWSQEELAAQLGVSRQSVSKWEGAQSVPDMQKVVQMSRLFGVTTDYLLKEELGEPEPAPAESAAPAALRDHGAGGGLSGAAAGGPRRSSHWRRCCAYSRRRRCFCSPRSATGRARLFRKMRRRASACAC